jgi:hypothetical protein
MPKRRKIKLKKEPINPIESIATAITALNGLYQSLEEKYLALDAIQLNLIHSISISNPEVFATFQEKVKVCLSELAERDLSHSYLAAKLCVCSGLPMQDKKPHLWLVPPRVDPPPVGSDPL